MKNKKKSIKQNQKRCFVVMGFGTKTDYATGRKLDLNKSYRLLIKPVVEARGLTCVRADEIAHSAVVDVSIYQELLKADIIIADLSTSNCNAFYELGIRHALRPSTTIVISEDKLSYPFDLNHVSISSYSHLGDAIDYEEVLRFQKTLGAKLDAVLEKEETDSPVYTFLGNLIPPALRARAARTRAKISDILRKSDETAAAHTRKLDPENQSLALVIEQAEQAIRDEDFILAKTRFRAAIKISTRCSGSKGSGNTYLVHRLVVATYKACKPNEVSALMEAKKLLEPFNLEDTNDPETLALAGVIEKKLYQKDLGDVHLENAIEYYERGFYLRNDGYNGTNLALLLNARACSSSGHTRDERIADVVWASRIRRKVLIHTDKYFHDEQMRRQFSGNTINSDDPSCDPLDCRSEERFWVLVNKAKAHFGLGEMEEYEKARALAEATQHEDWMMGTFMRQIDKLDNLLEEQESLLNSKREKTLELV